MSFALLATAALLLEAAPAPSPITTVGPPALVTDADVPENQPPPGSPEDRALWKAAFDQHATSQIEVERTRLMILDLRTGSYREGLAAAGKAAGPAASKRADEQWGRLAGAADEAYRASSRAPFNLRTGCRYELLRFGQAMGSKRGEAGAADLPALRAKLEVCHGRLDAFMRPLVEANDRLAAELDGARALLATRPGVRSESVEPVSAPTRPITER